MTFGNKTVWSYLPRPRFSKHAIVKKKQLRLFPYTHIQHKYAHTHTHTCPFPLLQLYNLNATDSLAKTSRAHLVIAVYFGMQRNSVIHDHVKLMASVSVEMKRRWEESADRRCWSHHLLIIPASSFTYSKAPPPLNNSKLFQSSYSYPAPAFYNHTPTVKLTFDLSHVKLHHSSFYPVMTFRHVDPKVQVEVCAG